MCELAIVHRDWPHFFGCLYSCPKGYKNEDCPLGMLKKYDFKGGVQLIEETDYDALKPYLEKHQVCLRRNLIIQPMIV